MRPVTLPIAVPAGVGPEAALHPGDASVRPFEPLLVPAPEAAAVCGVSPATWHRLRAAGKTPAPVRLGGSVRWRLGELRDWVAAGCPARREWEARQLAGGGRAS
jgi:predicted DNA-binding transcriptional regulator AlpA